MNHHQALIQPSFNSTLIPLVFPLKGDFSPCINGCVGDPRGSWKTKPHFNQRCVTPGSLHTASGSAPVKHKFPRPCFRTRSRLDNAVRCCQKQQHEVISQRELGSAQNNWHSKSQTPSTSQPALVNPAAELETHRTTESN